MSIEATGSILQNLRKRHRLQVLSSLASGPKTRRELESDVGLSRTTMSAIVGELLERQVVVQVARDNPAPGRQGRPTSLVALNPLSAASIGIELGRSRVGLTLLGFDGSVIRETSTPIPGPFELPARLDAAVAALEEALEDRTLRPESLIGLGIGIAGRHPQPSFTEGLPRKRDRDPEGLSLDPLRNLVEAPLIWDNSVRFAAVAERARSGHPDQDLLFVNLSAGISCGSVVNGTIVRGGGLAGELGHVSVDADGRQCWCGERGCLEEYLSVQAVLADARSRGLKCASISELASELAAGNEAAVGLVRWCGDLLGRALSNVMMLLDPQRVVLGGELATLGEPLLQALIARAEKHQLGMNGAQREYAISELPIGAAGRGAAQVALRTFSDLGNLV